MKIHLKAWWERLTGKDKSFSLTQVAICTSCLIAAGLSLLLLAANLVIGLYEASILLVVLVIVLSLLFYLARYRKMFRLVSIIFSILSYAALTGNFFLNYGINGPTVLGFFLTFLLLLTIAHKKYHLLIGVLHGGVMVVLFIIELYRPEWFISKYASPVVKVSDWSVSYIICLLFTYLIVAFLKNNYLRQNKKLEQLVLEKDKLLNIVAHDLRSPLSAIQSYLELLSEMPLGAEEAGIKRDLLNLTKRTNEMLVNTLNWSRSQMGGITIRTTIFDVAEVVSETVHLYRSLAERKGIGIDTTSCKVVLVMLDREMTSLIVRNLISNAIKFTPAGGKVIVEVEEMETFFEIKIKDTGIGISPAKLSQLFTLRSESTYGTASEKGVGLGLVLAQEFAKLQGGEISVKSGGEGSEFKVRLPIGKSMLL